MYSSTPPSPRLYLWNRPCAPGVCFAMFNCQNYELLYTSDQQIMNPDRLNHAMVVTIINVVGDYLDKINLVKLMTEFILRNDERCATFQLPN